MKNDPVVSIVMPTYNRAAMLERALRSVFGQSYTNFELVVLNDASTDGTKALLEVWAKKDPRVRPVHHEKNYYPDISRTLNEGMRLARGRYVARLDDDDYWCDGEKLAKQVAFLDAHPDCVIVGGGTIVVDEHDHERFRYRKLESDKAIRAKALMSNPFTHSTVMFRRDTALAVGGYGNFKNVEDWDLWLRMGTRGSFHNMPDYFVHYLMNEQSKTFLFKRSQSREIVRVIVAHRNEYPNFLPGFSLNAAQYAYSLLPLRVRQISYNFLSRLKRGISSERSRKEL